MNGTLQKHIFQSSTCLKSGEISAYLRSELPPEARRRVENHLLDCPLCSDAVDAFEETGLAAFQQLEDFSAFKKKLPANPASADTMSLTIGQGLARAAAIAAVFVVGLVGYFGFFRAQGPDSLYSEYYSSYENDIPLNTRTIAGMSSLNPSFTKALDSYTEKDYLAALGYFDQTLASDPSNEPAHFFAGMACLESGQPAKAVGYLEAISSGQGTYAAKAAWYLILAELKLGEKEKAKARLEEFLKSSAYKMTEAHELQAEL